jgi:hypothetical protein
LNVSTRNEQALIRITVLSQAVMKGNTVEFNRIFRVEQKYGQKKSS